MLAEVLAVTVSLQGVAMVTRGLDQMAAKFAITEKAVMRAKVAMAAFAVALAVAFAGVREWASEERFQVQLRTLTDSLAEYESRLIAIDKIARGGVFSKDDVYDAVLMFERAGQNAEKYMGIVEGLAARRGAGPGAMREAAMLVSMVAGGETTNLSRRLMTAGIFREELARHGVSDPLNVTADQMMKALQGIGEEAQEIARDMEDAFVSKLAAAGYQFVEMIQTIGGQGAPVIAPLIDGVAWLFETFKNLNIATKGWAGNLVLVSLALNAIVKMLPLLAKMKALFSFSAAVQGLAKFYIFLTKIIPFLQKWLRISRWLALFRLVRAKAAIAEAAALGNIGGAIAGAAILAGAGVGLYYGARALNGAMNRSMEDAMKPVHEANQGGAGNRPVRRSDIENQMYARFGEGMAY